MYSFKFFTQLKIYLILIKQFKNIYILYYIIYENYSYDELKFFLLEIITNF